jgi:predicted nucleic acid-binding protein
LPYRVDALGAGERSAIAVAINRRCAIAIDGCRATHRAVEEAGVAGNALTILRTQDIMVELIRRSFVSVETADAILIDCTTNHRFRLKISSFG